jgi:hypothetical protein
MTEITFKSIKRRMKVAFYFLLLVSFAVVLVIALFQTLNIN